MVLHPALGEYDQWHPSDNKSGSYFRLIPKDRQLLYLVHLARMANGEAKALVSEYRAQLLSPRADFVSIFNMIDALAETDVDAIKPAINEFEARQPPDPTGMRLKTLIGWGEYAAGNIQACSNIAASMPRINDTIVQAECLILLDKIKEVASGPQFQKLTTDPRFHFILSLGYSLKGQEAKAELARKNAIARLGGMGQDAEKIRKLLESDRPIEVKSLDQYYTQEDVHCLILATLGQRFPERRAEYFKEAAKYHILHRPPYQIVKRTLASKPRQGP
jgi:hypothetical protein